MRGYQWVESIPSPYDCCPLPPRCNVCTWTTISYRNGCPFLLSFLSHFFSFSLPLLGYTSWNVNLDTWSNGLVTHSTCFQFSRAVLAKAGVATRDQCNLNRLFKTYLIFVLKRKGGRKKVRENKDTLQSLASSRLFTFARRSWMELALTKGDCKGRGDAGGWEETEGGIEWNNVESDAEEVGVAVGVGVTEGVKGGVEGVKEGVGAEVGETWVGVVLCFLMRGVRFDVVGVVWSGAGCLVLLGVLLSLVELLLLSLVEFTLLLFIWFVELLFICSFAILVLIFALVLLFVLFLESLRVVFAAGCWVSSDTCLCGLYGESTRN